MTPAFKAAVAEVAEGDWQPLYRDLDGQRLPTGQEWAEVCYVPAELSSRTRTIIDCVGLRRMTMVISGPKWPL